MNPSSSNTSPSGADSSGENSDGDTQFTRTEDQVRQRRPGGGDNNVFMEDKDYEFVKDQYEKFGLVGALSKCIGFPDGEWEEALEALLILSRRKYGLPNEASKDANKMEPIEPRKKKGEKPILLWHKWEREYEKFIDDNFVENYDSEILVETADAPSALIKPLMKHQKEWLAWGMKQEEGPTRGGILADEMGMGKTIEAIALVLAKRELNQKTRVDDPSSLASTSSSDLPRIKATLVVCPVVAVTQWVNEIDKFTAKGSMKVLVHHGPDKEKSSEKFKTFDFVITTYGIVETEYRNSMIAPKEKSSRGGGSSKKQKKPKEPTEKILLSVHWNRIILDEAQYIKDIRRNTTKSIFALQSSYKWALTGTPLQNHVGDLYSLVRFLQVVPYSFYLCRKCDCRILEYRSFKDCSGCPHNTRWHFCWWNRYIAKPIRLHGNSDDGKRAMFLLSHKVLKDISLRRTKNDKATLPIPPKIVTIRLDALDEREKDYYTSLYRESKAQFNTYVSAGTAMNNYVHIFDLLTRLRQAVDHPYLVVYSITKASRHGNTLDTAQTEQMCGLCSVPEDLVVTPCAHTFCKACLLDYSVRLEKISCPTCSQQLTVDSSSDTKDGDQTFESANMGFKSSSILNRIKLDNFQTSTKIEALREEIRFMVERDGSAKGIVFSQFVTFLDLIHYSLQKSGVRCVQLDGSMTLAARDAVIKKFTDDPDCKILLMSLKAGGVALNLTVASHVFLMDPWWNPAVEKQAEDRVHRIGQFKTTRIVKFIIENSVEQRIMELRERKKSALEGTIDGSSEAMGKLTLNDLRFLFRRI